MTQNEYDTKTHYADQKTCCDAGKLSLSASLRCPCCGYLATKFNPQMLSDIHRAKQ